MTINTSLFECNNNNTFNHSFISVFDYVLNNNFSTKHISPIRCSTQIGYSTNKINKYLFPILSVCGFISNSILLLNFINKSDLKDHKKTTLKKMFSILPIVDAVTSVYWIVQTCFFVRAEDINNNKVGCFYLSLTYIFLSTFDFSFINCLLYHFRKINYNPIDGVLRPAKNLMLYVLISVVLGVVMNLFCVLVGNVGRSQFVTCFIKGHFSYKFILCFCVILLCFAFGNFIDKALSRLHSNRIPASVLQKTARFNPKKIQEHQQNIKQGPDFVHDERGPI